MDDKILVKCKHDGGYMKCQLPLMNCLDLFYESSEEISQYKICCSSFYVSWTKYLINKEHLEEIKLW